MRVLQRQNTTSSRGQPAAGQRARKNAGPIPASPRGLARSPAGRAPPLPVDRPAATSSLSGFYMESLSRSLSRPPDPADAPPPVEQTQQSLRLEAAEDSPADRDGAVERWHMPAGPPVDGTLFSLDAQLQKEAAAVRGVTGVNAPTGGRPPGSNARPSTAGAQVRRVISDCHFSVQLDHFIPGFRSYSVPAFRKVTIGYHPTRRCW
jgi:hypothetical protein